MKLALMALTIEIGLVRLFIHSWGWAAAFVLVYCALVYLVMWRKVFLLKKQNKNTSPIDTEYTVIQNSLNIRSTLT